MTTLPVELEDDLQGLVHWAARTFGPKLVLATSLANEDMVLLHALEVASQDLPSDARPSAFVLDTGRLHEETYKFLDRVRDRFTLSIHVYTPDHVALEALYVEQGTYGFRGSVEARKACCGVRKVQSLQRALAGKEAWLTGLRRAQSVTRADVPVFEHDAPGRLKIAPLVKWSSDDVLAYLKEHQVSRHPLHAQGYPSIGCEPCTRAVAPGEDERAGRWWWENPDSKECGLHTIGHRAVD